MLAPVADALLGEADPERLATQPRTLPLAYVKVQIAPAIVFRVSAQLLSQGALSHVAAASLQVAPADEIDDRAPSRPGRARAGTAPLRSAPSRFQSRSSNAQSPGLP
ncbi:hypothetical protein, partial [Actinomadura sp. SCN-SB]|uniref:hypothetical protein n=1 Tax=Actinomadura sp. SCN-SB TaxID=3373092 RepID=UPI00374FE2E7